MQTVNFFLVVFQRQVMQLDAQLAERVLRFAEGIVGCVKDGVEDLLRAVHQLVVVFDKLLRAVVHLLRAVEQFHAAVVSVLCAVHEFLCAVQKIDAAVIGFLCAVVQFLRAIQKILRAVVQIDARIDDLIRLVRNLRLIHVDIQRETHAVDGDRVHLKILRVGRDDDILLRIRQDDIAHLARRADVRFRRAVGDDVRAFRGIQRRGDLQRMAAEQVARIIRILADGEPDFHMSVFSRQLVGVDVPAVERIGHCEEPRQVAAVQVALIIDALRVAVEGDLAVLIFDGVLGVQGMNGGVIAVVHDIAAFKHVDGVQPFDFALIVQNGINDFFLAGLCSRQYRTAHHGQRKNHRNTLFAIHGLSSPYFKNLTPLVVRSMNPSSR